MSTIDQLWRRLAVAAGGFNWGLPILFQVDSLIRVTLSSVSNCNLTVSSLILTKTKTGLL